MPETIKIANPEPEDYLDWLEWKTMNLRKMFEANPTRPLFYEWKKWEKTFRRAMAADGSGRGGVPTRAMVKFIPQRVF